MTHYNMQIHEANQEGNTNILVTFSVPGNITERDIINALNSAASELSEKAREADDLDSYLDATEIMTNAMDSLHGSWFYPSSQICMEFDGETWKADYN